MLEPHLSFDLITKRNELIFVSLYLHKRILLASKCTPLVIVSLKRSPILKIKQKKRFLKDVGKKLVSMEIIMTS